MSTICPAVPVAAASMRHAGVSSSPPPCARKQPASSDDRDAVPRSSSAHTSTHIAAAIKKEATRAQPEIPAATTAATAATATATSAAPAPSTAPSTKVTNINVTDERFHLSMIALLGCVLSQLVAFEEAQHPQGRGPISMFHTAYVPSISIGSYLKRIALYTKVSSEVLIQSVLHVHQLMQRPTQPLIVNKLNIHRLLLTSVMATAKFFDDAHYNNAYFSYVGGVPLKELNALEVEFLSLLNFDFYVNLQTYQYFYTMVVEKNIHQNGCACSQWLAGVPATVPVFEYAPCPEVAGMENDCAAIQAAMDAAQTIQAAPVPRALPAPTPAPAAAAVKVASRPRALSSEMMDAPQVAAACHAKPQAHVAAQHSMALSSPRDCHAAGLLASPASSEATASTASTTGSSGSGDSMEQYSSMEEELPEELGSIRIEPHAESLTSTPLALAQVKTPKALGAHQYQHQSHAQQGYMPALNRSASPRSYVSSQSYSHATEGSPVSSTGSFSSYSHQGGSSVRHGLGHHSPSLSSQGSACYFASEASAYPSHHRAPTADMSSTPRQRVVQHMHTPKRATRPAPQAALTPRAALR